MPLFSGARGYTERTDAHPLAAAFHAAFLRFRAVDPLKIICVTCHARLTVRDESAIGKILACPRCGSMVQVTAPALASAAAAAAVVPAQRAANGQPQAAPAASQSAVREAPTFDEVGDFSAEQAPASSTAPAGQENLAQTATAGPVAPAPAPAGWGLGAMAALVAGSALAGSALVALVLALFRDDAPPPAPDVAAATIGDGSPSVRPDASSSEHPSAPEPAVDPSSAPAEPPALTQEPEVEVADQQTRPEDNPFAPEVISTAAPPTVAAPPAETVDPHAASASSMATADAAVSDPDKPRLRIDPLEFDPEGLNLSALLSGDAPHPSVPAIDDEAPAASVPPVAASDVPDAPVPPGAAAPPRDDVKPPAAPDVLLGRRLAGIKVDQMPLCEFLPLATSLSAMPVSVAAEELRLAAVSAATPVSLNVTDTTIEAALAAAFKPLRLTPVVDQRQIVLRRAVEDKARELNYPVADLGVDDAELVAWVKGLVQPQSWSAVAGSGKLAVDGGSLRIAHSERIGYETILFLEQYRHARGLPLRSKYPKEFLAAWSGPVTPHPRLAEPTTFTFSQSTPLGEIARWWQQELGIAVLVDWPALAQERLSPGTRVTAAALNQRWDEALTAALEPLGLGWRIVDSGTIEVSTRRAIEVEPRLKLYRVAAGEPSSVNEWRGAVTRLGGVDVASTVFYDARNRILLVRQPAPIQRALAERLRGAAAGDGD